MVAVVLDDAGQQPLGARLHGARSALLLRRQHARQGGFQRAAGLGGVLLLAEDFEARDVCVSLGQQVCGTSARTAGRELLGSTLLGGLLAILFWSALSLFPHLWMFFLWMLLFGLVLGRRLYALAAPRQTPGFWMNTLVTLIILLGQSVQDSESGKDVYTAFAVRMALFIAVTLYACAAVYLIDRRRFQLQRRQGRAALAPEKSD